MNRLIPTSSDYGTCPCAGTYESVLVEVRMTVGDEQIQLADVSQGKCPRCGSRVYKAGVLQEIESLMRGEEPPPRSPSAGLLI